MYGYPAYAPGAYIRKGPGRPHSTPARSESTLSVAPTAPYRLGALHAVLHDPEVHPAADAGAEALPPAVRVRYGNREQMFVAHVVWASVVRKVGAAALLGIEIHPVKAALRDPTAPDRPPG